MYDPEQVDGAVSELQALRTENEGLRRLLHWQRWRGGSYTNPHIALAQGDNGKIDPDLYELYERTSAHPQFDMNPSYYEEEKRIT